MAVLSVVACAAIGATLPAGAQAATRTCSSGSQIGLGNSSSGTLTCITPSVSCPSGSTCTFRATASIVSALGIWSGATAQVSGGGTGKCTTGGTCVATSPDYRTSGSVTGICAWSHGFVALGLLVKITCTVARV